MTFTPEDRLQIAHSIANMDMVSEDPDAVDRLRPFYPDLAFVFDRLAELVRQVDGFEIRLAEAHAEGMSEAGTLAYNEAERANAREAATRNLLRAVVVLAETMQDDEKPARVRTMIRIEQLTRGML